MFSFVGDTVLDPFLGSGTTSLVAKKLDRNSVGYEINKDFLPIIKEKIGFSEKNMFEETVFEFIKQEKLSLDFNKEINKLKYIFKDAIKLNKQIDPRKLQFGSKISFKKNYE